MNINDPAFPTDVSVLSDDSGTLQTEIDNKLSPGMPLKVYAAIHLKVPDSGIKELDDMIRKANRDEIAMSCLGQWADANGSLENRVAEICYEYADAMLEQSEKEGV